MQQQAVLGVLGAVQKHLVEHPEITGVYEIASCIRREANGVISDVEVLEILRQLRYDTVGLGPLDALMQQSDVTDVVINSVAGVWVDRGNGLERSSIQFHDDEEVRRLATRLLVASGRRLDSAQCFGDGRVVLPNGTAIRVHAMLSPPAEQGTLLSLRVLRNATVTLRSLCDNGTFSPELYDALRGIIQARLPFLVVGGTGSGKTTLLAALLDEVPPGSRIITIEDTAELKLVHPHHVPLITRTANIEGTGAVGMSDLLKQSLRMRPDRIVLGEIRGAEVIDLLAALNTGHEGCAGTIHANTPKEVPARLAALAALGGMSAQALGAQIQAAAPVVLGMARHKGKRILAHIGVMGNNPPTVRMLWQHSSGWLTEELPW